MPNLVRYNNLVYHADGYPQSHLHFGETRVSVTQQLYSFAKERAYANESEWIQLEDGTYDLHPDIRWCPGDRVPSE
jgi:hypothetical protein